MHRRYEQGVDWLPLDLQRVSILVEVILHLTRGWLVCKK